MRAAEEATYHIVRLLRSMSLPLSTRVIEYATGLRRKAVSAALKDGSRPGGPFQRAVGTGDRDARYGLTPAGESWEARGDEGEGGEGMKKIEHVAVPVTGYQHKYVRLYEEMESALQRGRGIRIPESVDLSLFTIAMRGKYRSTHPYKSHLKTDTRVAWLTERPERRGKA